ncbi:GntR family transcriptional regulator [Peptacetobacter hominis]|uniref:GntR family transcriptional regulator n=1 Tax=Peptacetobacter hominis TaxID=2743610 RepID=A0A544QYI4_9FIRM|nr:GntR family transcriptional regulator [Peptacetobacter hominis]TQQ85817.1 GntR family transcriptional regulator [Peptacetobacter hominis]
MAWNFDNNRPLYIQLLEVLKLKIVSGEIKPGEKFPTVRNLAEEAEVNPNTVQRALSELEKEELIETRRTIGKFVTENADRIESIKEELAGKVVEKFMINLKAIGYDENQILELIKNSIKEEQ